MKGFLRFAAVTAAFAAVLVLLDFLLYPCTFIRSDIHSVLTEKSQDLILGASHGKMDLSPETMQAVTGRTGHNLCIGGEYPIDSYYLLKVLVEKGKQPDRVVYVLSPEYFMEEKEEGNNALLFYHELPPCAAKLSYFAASISRYGFRSLLFPWYEYSLGYEISVIGDTVRKKLEQDYSAASYETESQKYHSDGFVERYPVDAETFSYAGLKAFSEERVRPENLDYMRKLIGLCRAEEIDFVCVMPPVPAPTLKHFSEGFRDAQQFFNRFFDSCEARFINFNDPDGEWYRSFTHNVKAYTDLDGHMNGEAARAFSHLLAQILEEPGQGES